MKQILWIFIAIIGTMVTAHASELSDKLLAIKNVSSVELIDQGLFSERYVVMFEQPIDHKNPKKGTFEQRYIVGHAGFDRPTVMVTEGYGAAYALTPKYRGEISTKFNTNLVFVEHRYFGESTPEPRNWAYMTGENAATDLHAIRTAMASIYPAKWLATGISKGGQNTMIYATFYPGDVDAYVPYVGPVCFGVEDGRHEPFLENVGTQAERDVIRNFQIEILKRRDKIFPAFEAYCSEKGYKFQIPLAEVYDYCVLEYPFSLWQMGTAIITVPSTDATDEELFDSLIAIASPVYFSISDEPSFFVQAARELGYYGYDLRPYQGLLEVKDSRGYLKRVFLPKDAQKIKFNSKLSSKITKYLADNDPRMIFVYGQTDPWSAVMPSPILFEGKQNMMLKIQPEGSHRARISTLPESDRDQVWACLSQWLK